MEKKLPRILFAAEKSGTGKTTVVCGLLQALKNRGIKSAACKCGPDFIDPMFHSEIIGARGANLDLFFTDENTTKQLLWETAQDCDIAVLEGAMGFYDGVGGSTHRASAYHLAAATATPVILVLDAKGASLSLCATVRGFMDFRRDSGICGVILNRCTPSQYAMLEPMLKDECGVEALGYLPYIPECTLKSRCLGLVTAEEVEGIKEKLQRLAEQTEATVRVERIAELAKSAGIFTFEEQRLSKATDSAPRLGVARDRAFCFYYRENLSLLEKLGAIPVYFSPLTDSTLPENIDGLYLGGGYPELYGEKLSGNITMLESIKTAILGGLPTVAECGGFLYLHRSLTDGDGRSYPMAGVIDAGCANTGKLNRFGYVTVTAEKDNLLCDKGEAIAAHEFHYFDSTDNGGDFAAEKPVSGRRWRCIHGTKTFFAGFPHLYFYSNVKFAVSFVAAAAKHKEEREARW